MANWEPIYQNQFMIDITFPALLGGAVPNTGTEQGVDTVTLSQQVKKLDGLPEITPLGTVEQYYKFSKRTYAAARPEETTAELEIDFEVNLNDNNEMYVYNMLRAWANIIFDPLNGSMGLKRQYVGAMAVHIFNKRGAIFRTFEFPSVYLMDNLTEMELDFQGDDLYTVTAKFKADYWNEKLAGMRTDTLGDDIFNDEAGTGEPTPTVD